MRLPRLWSSGQGLATDPLKTFRREMEDMFRSFGPSGTALNIGAAPAMNIAETGDAIEVTAELPGIDEKDIKVSVERNCLVIAGKKEESKRDEKDWHVEERSYGSFYRSASLPFSPGDAAITAHLDEGVLHVHVKKPPEAAASSKSIEIKSGAPPKTD